MRTWSCAAIGRRLEAWHDGELPPVEHYAVDQHLAHCESCAAAARDLLRVGELLRVSAARAALPADEADGLRTGILARVAAEQALSWPRRLDEWFEDLHLVWAGLSAAAGVLVCIGLLAGMAWLVPPEREDSLAGLLSALARPGSDRNPVTLNPAMQPPRPFPDGVVPAVFHAPTEGDLVLALAAVITQEGRVSRSEVLLANRDDKELVLALMNAVAAARFQPASLAGEPVAVNLVWLVTQTTVRGRLHS